MGRLPWRVKNCGGSLVNGKATCDTVCICGANKNYVMLFKLLQVAASKELEHLDVFCYVRYTSGILSRWDEVAVKLLDIEPFKGSKLSGMVVKQKFEEALEEYETAHSLNASSAGFETHPEDSTPYLELLGDIVAKRKKFFIELEREKVKNVSTSKNMLFHEAQILGTDGNGIDANELEEEECTSDVSVSLNESDDGNLFIMYPYMYYVQFMKILILQL